MSGFDFWLSPSRASSSVPPDDAPLILTLRLDDAHRVEFDRLREAHFPPERNHLRAHVTLFHALPGADLRGIVETLREAAGRTPTPEVAVTEPYSLGRGVAFRLRSDKATALRKSLAGAWADRLTPQDRSFSGLHVTVQNKVPPADARALLADLQASFVPSRFESPGLDLWRYLGGPWAHAGAFEFVRPTDSSN